MQFPVEAICIHSTWENGNTRPLPAFTQFTLTNGLTTKAFVGHVTGDPERTVYLHLTDMIILKPETVSGLYRRALNRKGMVSQEYYIKDFNRLIEFQLRSIEDELDFCMTSEDALEQAVKFEQNYVELGLTELQSKNQSIAYLRYAVVLEKLEAVIDQHFADEKGV